MLNSAASVSLVGYEAYTVDEDTKVVLSDGSVNSIDKLTAKDVETKGLWIVHDDQGCPDCFLRLCW